MGETIRHIEDDGLVEAGIGLGGQVTRVSSPDGKWMMPLFGLSKGIPVELTDVDKMIKKRSTAARKGWGGRKATQEAMEHETNLGEWPE